jgi:hypothetical protein
MAACLPEASVQAFEAAGGGTLASAFAITGSCDTDDVAFHASSMTCMASCTAGSPAATILGRLQRVIQSLPFVCTSGATYPCPLPRAAHHEDDNADMCHSAAMYISAHEDSGCKSTLLGSVRVAACTPKGSYGTTTVYVYHQQPGSSAIAAAPVQPGNGVCGGGGVVALVFIRGHGCASRSLTAAVRRKCVEHFQPSAGSTTGRARTPPRTYALARSPPTPDALQRMRDSVEAVVRGCIAVLQPSATRAGVGCAHDPGTPPEGRVMCPNDAVSLLTSLFCPQEMNNIWNLHPLYGMEVSGLTVCPDGRLCREAACALLAHASRECVDVLGTRNCAVDGGSSDDTVAQNTPAAVLQVETGGAAVDLFTTPILPGSATNSQEQTSVWFNYSGNLGGEPLVSGDIVFNGTAREPMREASWDPLVQPCQHPDVTHTPHSATMTWTARMPWTPSARNASTPHSSPVSASSPAFVCHPACVTKTLMAATHATQAAFASALCPAEHAALHAQYRRFLLAWGLEGSVDCASQSCGMGPPLFTDHDRRTCATCGTCGCVDVTAPDVRVVHSDSAGVPCAAARQPCASCYIEAVLYRRYPHAPCEAVGCLLHCISLLQGVFRAHAHATNEWIDKLYL